MMNVCWILSFRGLKIFHMLILLLVQQSSSLLMTYWSPCEARRMGKHLGPLVLLQKCWKVPLISPTKWLQIWWMLQYMRERFPQIGVTASLFVYLKEFKPPHWGFWAEMLSKCKKIVYSLTLFGVRYKRFVELEV